MEKITKDTKIESQWNTEIYHGMILKRPSRITLQQSHAGPGHSAARTGKVKEDCDGAGGVEKVFADHQIEKGAYGGKPKAFTIYL